MAGSETKVEQSLFTHMLQRMHLDPQLLAGIATVLVLGIFVLYSASGNDADMLVGQLARIGLRPESCFSSRRSTSRGSDG